MAKAKPVNAVGAKRLVREFVADQEKQGLIGGIFGVLITKVAVELLSRFVEWLLKDHNLVPKSEGE